MITSRINVLMESSKMIQNEFLQFLIRNKLAKAFEDWNRNSTTQALSVIPGMPMWIHKLQQYCVDQLGNINKKQRFQQFCDKLMSNNGCMRATISEKDIDSTLAIQLLIYENYLYSHTAVGAKATYRQYVNNARINRNAFSHYTPNTSNDTKMADIKNLLDNLDIFMAFIISDLNARGESTIVLSELKNRLVMLQTEFADIVGEREEHIQYLSRITAYVNKIENSFIEMISKFVHLDINEEIVSKYTSSYVDEILIDEKTIPRSGKIEEILPQIEKRKMLLTGGPGVGKSTTLSFLAYRDAVDLRGNSDGDKESMPIPVLIHLNTLTKEDVSIIDKIAEDMKISSEQIRYLLNQNRLNLYLDGLNEIPNASESTLKQKRITEIKEVAMMYQETMIVCSTRESDVGFLDGFSCFRVLQMSDLLVKEFIEKNTQSNHVRNLLLNDYEKTISLIKGVRTPLYVTRLISVVAETGELPVNESKIIGTYLYNLLKREQFDKAANIKAARVEELLSEFAYVVREKYKTNAPISYSNIIKIFDGKQMYSKLELRYILDHCIDLEIIVPEDEERELYAFAHETYQEYYRAQVDDFTI